MRAFAGGVDAVDAVWLAPLIFAGMFLLAIAVGNRFNRMTTLAEPDDPTDEVTVAADLDEHRLHLDFTRAKTVRELSREANDFMAARRFQMRVGGVNADDLDPARRAALLAQIRRSFDQPPIDESSPVMALFGLDHDRTPGEPS